MLRLEFSTLNKHKFRHNFQCMNPMCVCNTGVEDNAHFFLHCPLFVPMHNDLLDQLSHLPGLDLSNIDSQALLNLLLYGSPKFNEIDNRVVLEASTFHVSSMESIKYRVPQGSCLGLLLFLIYINDLPLSLKFGEGNMYADDTSISYSSDSVTNINDSVNEDLNHLKNWLESNKLSLNVAKTQSMLIGSRNRLKKIGMSENPEPALKIGEERISIVKHTKYLGVQIDQL